jgi:hypothetical protein
MSTGFAIDKTISVFSRLSKWLNFELNELNRVIFSIKFSGSQTFLEKLLAPFSPKIIGSIASYGGVLPLVKISAQLSKPPVELKIFVCILWMISIITSFNFCGATLYILCLSASDKFHVLPKPSNPRSSLLIYKFTFMSFLGNILTHATNLSFPQSVKF